MHSTKRKVVIIGAGIAGLSAAEHLHSNGFNDFIVLEASDRIGGRIKSVKFGEDENAVVELGANYIEGLSLSSSIITLINEKCPESIPISADRCVPRRTSLFYRSDGRPIDPDMSKKMFGVLEGLLAEESEGNPLIEDFARAKLEKFLLENGDEYDDGDAEDIRAILNFCLNYCKNVFGGPLEDLPLKTAGADHSDYIPGGSLKVAGMSKVVEVLAERIPAGAIKLKSEVSKISTKIGEVIVKTADGTSYTTEHVIITCPLGFLKENAAKMFNPPLPAEKMEAIDKISFGKIGKVFLHYKNPFWTKGSGRVSLAWTNDDFCMKTEKQWYKNIEVFDEAIDNDNVLVCWVCYGGVDAIETMDEEQLKLECTAVLRKFLQNPSIPVPEKVIRSGWASDRLFRGTYCYKGVATTQKHLDDFEAPIIEGDVPRLMFAGEAIRCNGCIHGARDSGLREAEKLLRLYNFQRVPNLEF